MLTFKATQPGLDGQGQLQNIVQIELNDHNHIMDQRMTQGELINFTNEISPLMEMAPHVNPDAIDPLQPMGFRINPDNFNRVVRILRMGQYTRYAANDIRAILAVTMTVNNTDNGEYMLCEITINIIADITQPQQ